MRETKKHGLVNEDAAVINKLTAAVCKVGTITIIGRS